MLCRRSGRGGGWTRRLRMSGVTERGEEVVEAREGELESFDVEGRWSGGGVLTGVGVLMGVMQ